MINAETVRLEARLAAMEFAIAQAHALIQWQLGITDEQARQVYEKSGVAFAQYTVPGIPPEFSDHYAAELHDAVLRLQTMTKAIRAQAP